MSGNNILVDTNILIYVLNGNKQIAKCLDNKELFISVITEMEMLGIYDITPTGIKAIKSLIDDCYLVELNAEIKEKAIILKQKSRIKLPDAIIAATSMYLNCTLFTADKAFSKIQNLNCVILEV
jgi:predicted nucleic acid-binding protein